MSFINGALRSGTGTSHAVHNPADGSVVGTVEFATPAVMTQAIDAAAQAALTWGNTTAAARERILLRVADVIEANTAELVRILTDEAGSTFGKAMFEVGYTAGMLRSAAGEARRTFGHVIPADEAGVISMTIRRPLGVVAAISPFNYPFLLGTKKIAMALAAGNAVVQKPSEETSLIALKVAELFSQAGLPDGVLNVVPGEGASLGAVLLEDPRVRLISFTGSTRVGRLLAVECARQGKKITLELGGKSPVVVLADADLTYAVNTATFGGFTHQGQICMAGTRIIVEAPLYDAFVEAFAAKVAGLKTGSPREPDTIIGPLIRARQCEFIAARIEAARQAGARVATGGSYQGNFFAPTVVADVTSEMSIFQDELFGPVICVIKARDADHALELANDTKYGLSAAVLTNDLNMAFKFAQGMESGSVHINSSTIDDNPHAPFGGVKDSGMGREGGQWSMEEMTETKWVTIQMGERHYPF